MLNQRKRLTLKKKLDYHYKYFDYSQISPDPLEFPHRFKNYFDIEISAFISSVFAFGNVRQILNTLEIIHSLMENQPYNFVLNFSGAKYSKLFKNVKHRFYTSEDIIQLFEALNQIYISYGSIKYYFLLYNFEEDENLKEAISFFSRSFLSLASKGNYTSHGMKFMIPNPYNGSACKRMNLFLRWMVRKDELDFGLWEEISPSKLVIPVDTHVAKICKQLELTKQKSVSWEMAEEITSNLKKFDPSDPVKYDFAICHIGMRKILF